MDKRAHWEAVYTTKPRNTLSWFEEVPSLSLELIGRALGEGGRHVIDVGGGDSSLAARLIEQGVSRVTVIDISQAALDRGRELYGDGGGLIERRQADVIDAWSAAPADVWHDRAVFHFLTDEADRTLYVHRARSTVVAGGGLVVATFAEDGPERCSGLPVRRHSLDDLTRTFTGFTRAEWRRHEHRTPSGAVQAFLVARFVRDSDR